MKRIVSIIMAAVVLVSLTACGNNTQAETKGAETAAESDSNKPASAAKRPVARDDDNPELTDEQLASLRKMQEKRSAGCRR